MYLRDVAPASASFHIDMSTPLLAGHHDSGSGGGGATQGWSSIIGIVTAICGNVLISFALNTQRYAHIRLSRDREERQQECDKARKRKQKREGKGVSGYGSMQQVGEEGEEEDEEDIAEQRAKKNAQSRPTDDLEEAHESDPLIPKIDVTQEADREDAEEEGDDEGADGYDEKEEEEQKEKSYLRSPIWWLGIGLMVVGEAGNFLAYGFAPASIVSPLGVVALVSNCLIAPLLLHERFRLRDGLGVIIAVAGCVIVVLSASGSNPKLDQDRIWRLITRWEFETYFGLTLFLIIVLMVMSNKFGDRSILIDIGLVGLFGGYTALSTKGVASLLSNTIWRVVTFPITYLLVAVLVGTAVMQIKYINRALQRFNATMVIPTQFVMFTISVIVGSAILYRDFERTTGEDAAEFIGGCALTFLGVWCITSGRKGEGSHDEEEGQRDDSIKLLDEEGVQPEIREREDGRGDKKFSIASASDAKPIAQRTVNGGQQVPSLSVTPEMEPAASSQEHLPNLDQRQPLKNDAWDMSDANIAAIHSTDASQLPQAPSDSSRRKQPPPMHATTSEPVIPTSHLAASRAKTPLNRTPSGPPSTPSPTKRKADNPLTTPRRERAQFLDPSDTPMRQQQERQRLVSRNSMVGLLPGPLTSPLSGSLSAIVADSLRRGVDRFDSSVSTFRRPRRASRQASNLEDVRESMEAVGSRPKRHSITSGDIPFQDDNGVGIDDAADRSQGSGSPGRRSRSFSATVGGFFQNAGGGGKKWASARSEDKVKQVGKGREEDEQ